MESTDIITCPVSGCPFEGTLSRTIHHITERDDEQHTWEALGYQHSWDFRKIHTNDSSKDDASELGSSESTYQDAPEKRLEQVPGIGHKRAAKLRDAGYSAPGDVATASVSDLSDVPLLSETSARCIQTTAQEECGYSDTVISEMAARMNAERDAVYEAYADLAAVSVPPDEARQALTLLFDSTAERSVMQLSGYAVRYRYFLFEEGFEQLSDVAEASVEALTDAGYIHETLAEHLRETAEELRTQDPEESTDGSAAGAAAETTTTSGGQATAHEKSDQTRDADGEPIEAPADETFPDRMTKSDRWLLWKATDNGRKVPRAPWETGDPLQYVDAMDPSNWVSFADAQQWRSKLPHQFNLAYALTRDDDIVFLDLDDVIVDEHLSSEAQALIDRADSYTAVSTSGTGIHIFVSGSLGEDIKSLTGPLDESGDQSLEVYDQNRFVAVTGDHLEGTPTDITSGDRLLDELEDEYASVSSATPDRTVAEPERTRAELQEIETTHDIQDIFDAISQTRPSDIRMRSTQTQERGDGTYSYDPSWVRSDSGTRLAVTDDGWIYRKGMIALDALQVVALEEGIITDEREYPEASDFWDAVDALRDRGAHIPKFDPEGEPLSETSDTDPDAEIDNWEVAKRLNYGDRVRGYLHPYDRDYQEDLALELTPILIEAAESLYLSPAVTYRAAELYAKGHAAGVVPGAAHESTLGAALRIAAIEADTPRPLADIADAVEEDPTSIRNKFQRLMKETDLSDTLDISDFIVDPVEYVPYMARHLGVVNDTTLCDSVRELLAQVDHDGGSNPISEVAAAFYVAMKQSDGHSTTQADIARAAGLSKVTIRNNYRKYTDDD